MFRYLKENSQFFILIFLWIFFGSISSALALPVVLAGVYLMRRNGDYFGILAGFWVMLILSDSMIPALGFAKSAKHVYAVVFALVFFADRKLFEPDFRFIKLFLVFFIVASVSMLLSTNFIVSAQKTLSYFLLYIATPGYILYLYRTEGKEVFAKIIYLGMTVLLAGIIMKYLFPGLGFGGGRFTGVFGNPNQVGIFSVLVFLLFKVLQEFWPDILSKRDRLFFYLLIALSIYWSGSRNALISVLIFLVIYRFYKVAPALGFLVVVLTVVLYQVIENNMVELILAFGLEEYFRLETLESGSGRFIAWEFAWEKLQDFFFLGRGIANDELTMRPHYDYLERLGHQGGVHNSYLSMWMNVGLIGMLSFFVPLLWVFIRASKSTRVALPVMYTVLFTIIFESWLVASQNPDTIILVMILSLLFYILPELSRDEIVNTNIHEQPKPDIRGIPRGSIA